MTNKTEDKFYFGKSGQPERFARAQKTMNALEAKFMVVLESLSSGKNVKFRTLATSKHDAEQQARYAYGEKWEVIAVVQEFSNDGNPDEFDLSEACWEGYEPVGTKQKDGRTVPNCVPKDKNEQPEEFGSEAPRIKAMESQLSDWIKQRDLLVKDIKRNPNDERAQRHLTRVRQEINALITQIDNAKRGAAFSRPGQPERFAKPQFRSVKLYDGYLRIDVNQGSGWERYDTTHEESFDGLEDYERGWEKAYSRGLRWSGGSWRIPTNKFSRPGQPERFAATVPQKWIRQWENSYEIKVHDEKPGRWTFRNVHDDRSYDITADSFEDAIARLKRIAPSGEYKISGYQSSEWRAAQRSRRFSSPGQPERLNAARSVAKAKFADGTESFLTIKGVRYRIVGTRKDARGNLVYELHGISKTAHPVPFTLVKFLDDKRWVLWGAHGGEVARGKIESSRPGQPERFAAQIVSKRGTKRTEIKRDATGKWAAVLIQSNRTGVPGEGADEQVLEMKWYATEANARTAAAKMLSARPGQPDKFDASSLERGSFAEASKSPILGKLLSEKAMPEGGWRAVQAGSDTLVISFEDGDVAGNFARRVAGKGYSATNPVQAIGRYWNVEVKNG